MTKEKELLFLEMLTDSRDALDICIVALESKKHLIMEKDKQVEEINTLIEALKRHQNYEEGVLRTTKFMINTLRKALKHLNLQGGD